MESKMVEKVVSSLEGKIDFLTCCNDLGSSQIKQIIVQTYGKDMFILFKQNDVYKYSDFADSVAANSLKETISSGGSVGKWLNKEVKGKFDYEKLTLTEEDKTDLDKANGFFNFVRNYIFPVDKGMVS